MTVPNDFTYLDAKQVIAHGAAALIAALAPGHGTIVQAGGCIGLWPLALAAHFDRVLTCEPAPTNYAALAANVADTPAIVACPYALGDRPGRVGLTRPKPQAGVWTVTGDGDIPQVTVDALVGDTRIDALILDVEGREVDVWQGAATVIARDRPLLWFEYLQHRPALDGWLAWHGYAPARETFGPDRYSTHPDRRGGA